MGMFTRRVVCVRVRMRGEESKNSLVNMRLAATHFLLISRNFCDLLRAWQMCRSCVFHLCIFRSQDYLLIFLFY